MLNKILTILLPFVALIFIRGTCSLVAFGYYRENNFSLIFTSIVYTLILIVLYFNDKINFWNLIYLRVFGDVLMAMIRLYFQQEREL